jgi:amphi-Trp domain-containing protein
VRADDHPICVTTVHPVGCEGRSTAPDRDRGSGVTEFEHEERFPRQRAAELLADIAYALTMGDTLEVRTSSKNVRVPVGDTVVLTRGSRADGDRVEVEVHLRWSAVTADEPDATRSWSPADERS